MRGKDTSQELAAASSVEKPRVVQRERHAKTTKQGRVIAKAKANAR